MDNQLIIRAAFSWRHVCDELGVRLIAPFRPELADRLMRPAIAYLPDFGSPMGMIVDGGDAPDYSGEPLLLRYADDIKAYYSLVNVQSFQKVNGAKIRECLADWGFFQANLPEFMSPERVEP